MEKIVGGHYKLRRRIGAGSFGEIYSAENMHSHRRVAIKMESSRSKVPQLAYESKLYAIFSGGTGIPRLHWYGTEGSRNIMVIDLLGKSLEDLFVQCHHKFSLKTVLMLADQMISCVEFIHNKNFIHRDIKPDNFAMGLGPTSNQVFIIDYGLSKKYRDQHTHTHIPYVEGKSLTGTARYASVGALKGVEQSRRDDLESLGYVWLYLLRGGLPWMGLNGKDQKQKYDRICDVKSKTSFTDLCKGFPNEFVKYFNTVRNLRFTDKPNYSELKQMFRDLFSKLGYIYDYQYDWINANSNINQSKPSKQSAYAQVISEAKGNAKKVSTNNNQITKQASTLAKIHSIPVFLDNENINESKPQKNHTQNQNPVINEKPINQSCFVVNKNINISKTQDDENINENNSYAEKDIKPNLKLTKNQNKSRMPQSALAGNNRREKLHRQQQRNEQYTIYNRMNNMNSAEIRNSSSNRHERTSTQRGPSELRPRTRTTNTKDLESPRRRVATNTSRASTARKTSNNGPKENNARRLLMDYWLEESRNRRPATKQRVFYHS